MSVAYRIKPPSGGFFYARRLAAGADWGKVRIFGQQNTHVMLEKGLSAQSRTQVTAENTAARMGSGDMEVFATPALVALLENGVDFTYHVSAQRTSYNGVTYWVFGAQAAATPSLPELPEQN